MSETRFLSVHYFIRSFVLLGFSSYIVLLSKTGALQYYIAPRMMIYVQASAVILYILACYQGYMALRAFWGNRVVCDCEHRPSRSMIGNGIAYGLFVLPLLVGFLLPDTAMSSSIGDKKGMNLTSPGSGKIISSAAWPSPNPTPGSDRTVGAAGNNGDEQNPGTKPNGSPIPGPQPSAVSKLRKDQTGKSLPSSSSDAEL